MTGYSLYRRKPSYIATMDSPDAFHLIPNGEVESGILLPD